MIIRPCYRVLKSINYLCSQSDSKTTSNLDIMVYFHQRTKGLDLTDTLKQLIEDGYITATIDDVLVSDIRPTYKGKHYRQYRWISTKETLLKSFIFPVLVAFVTTLLTLALSGIFTVAP